MSRFVARLRCCLVVATIAVGVCACEGTAEDRAAPDASDAATACALEGDRCVGGEQACCGQVYGYRVTADGCISSALTMLVCGAREICGIKPNLAVGCLRRVRPGAGEGGADLVDLYQTPSTWPESVLGPDLAPCSADEEQKVAALERCR